MGVLRTLEVFSWRREAWMEKGGLGLSTDGGHPETQFRRMALQGLGTASNLWGWHSINSL